LISAVARAVGALKGPFHGGASGPALGDLELYALARAAGRAASGVFTEGKP